MSRFFLNVDVLHILAFEHKLMLSDTTNSRDRGPGTNFEHKLMLSDITNSRDRGQGTNFGNE